MSFVTNPIGIKGESEAAKMLENKGFHVIEQNWRMKNLEVDLIAENKNVIVFAEVKARTSFFGKIRPEEYVDEAKKLRMIAAANAYIKYHKKTQSPRFDIIGIVLTPDGEKITYSNHLENAFQPKLKAINSGSYSGAWKWHQRNKTIKNKPK